MSDGGSLRPTGRWYDEEDPMARISERFTATLQRLDD
jgi:hypothetical protein